MVYLCQDNLCAARQPEILVCLNAREYKKGCRACISNSPAANCYCAVPCSDLVNVDEHGNRIYYNQGDLVDEIGHNVAADWSDFIAMHMEIRDEGAHNQQQNDLVEHL